MCSNASFVFASGSLRSGVAVGVLPSACAVRECCLLSWLFFHSALFVLGSVVFLREQAFALSVVHRVVVLDISRVAAGTGSSRAGKKIRAHVCLFSCDAVLFRAWRHCRGVETWKPLQQMLSGRLHGSVLSRSGSPPNRARPIRPSGRMCCTVLPEIPRSST